MLSCLDAGYVATSPPISYYNDIHSNFVLVCILAGQDIKGLTWTYQGAPLSTEAQETAVTTNMSTYEPVTSTPITVYQSFLRLCLTSDSLGLQEGDYSCEVTLPNSIMSPPPAIMSVCPMPGKIMEDNIN